MSPTTSCIIIDDEQLAIDTLKWQLTEFCTGVQVVKTFTNPLAAHNHLLKHKVDLCFLDIDMPEMSGFDFINLWNGKPPFDIIFATAYSEFAVQAFKVSALDYLLKPIDEEDLVSTVNKYKSQQSSPTLEAQLALLIDRYKSPETQTSRIALPTSEGVHMVDYKNIIRLEADSNYTKIYLVSGLSILVSKTLKEVEKLLDPALHFRIHQSYTININHIKMYQRGTGGSVILTDSTVLPVSKHRKAELLERLGM